MDRMDAQPTETIPDPDEEIVTLTELPSEQGPNRRVTQTGPRMSATATATRPEGPTIILQGGCDRTCSPGS